METELNIVTEILRQADLEFDVESKVSNKKLSSDLKFLSLACYSNLWHPGYWYNLDI